MKSEKTELKIDKKETEELKKRLLNTRFPDEDEKIISKDSVTLKKMKSLIKYWSEEYDMENIQKKYNSLPLYRIKNKDSWVYFNRTGKKEATGLLMIHGWPDTSLSYLKASEKLNDDFDIVIPEIPGFGPGGPVTGSDIKKVAKFYFKIMEDLGKEEFYIHGEDFGAVIAREMALMDPKRIKAIHVTMLNHATLHSEEQVEKGNREEEASLKASKRYQYELSGYSTLQSTKPQDIAYSLSDSPSGLLAWIYSQFLSWSGKGTGISDEEIIDTAMVYWIFNTMPSAARYYKLDGEWGEKPQENKVPTFVLSSPYDIGIPVKRLAEKTDNIKGWKNSRKGGHFIAREIPYELLESLLSMKEEMETKDK